MQRIYPYLPQRSKTGMVDPDEERDKVPEKGWSGTRCRMATEADLAPDFYTLWPHSSPEVVVRMARGLDFFLS